MGDFTKLKVWQLSVNLSIKIFKVVKDNSMLRSDFRFKSQLTSSAVSIASNIAEGDELKTPKQAIKHFYYAKGSTAELLTQLIIARDIGALEKENANKLIVECRMISAALLKMITARKKWQTY